jgi:charged multivesicular body protein 5
MNRLFGKSVAKPAASAVPPPSLTDATTSLTSRITSLDEKIKGLDAELSRYKSQMEKVSPAVKASIMNKAKDALKRKKMYESQRQQLSNQSFTIEQTSFAIDSVKDYQTTIAAMSEANKTLKAEQKKLNIDNIEDIQDELEDMLDDFEELNQVMNRTYGAEYEIDDADIEAELACLEDELGGLDVQESVSMPSLPSTSSIPISNTNTQTNTPATVFNAPQSTTQIL